MISKVIDKPFKYVTFLNAAKEPINGITSKPIIYSDYINHELTAMLFAKNYSPDKLAISQIVYDGLTDEEVTLLASVGCFQICTRDQQDKYELNSLLDTIEITAILIPKPDDSDTNVCHYLYFSNKKDFVISDEGTLVDFSDATSTNSNRLLLITKSSSPVKNLSQEIHNNMIIPHSHIHNYVMFDKDLSDYMSLAVIDVDLMFDRQSLTKLANILEPFDSIGDTIYSKGIYDNLNNSYIYALDQIPSKL